MYALKLGLSLLYMFFSGKILIMIYSGDRPITSLAIVCFNFAMAAALNNKGGKVTRYLAYTQGGVMSMFLIGALYMIVSPIWGRTSDLTLLAYFSLLGGLGVISLFSLRFSKYQKTT